MKKSLFIVFCIAFFVCPSYGKYSGGDGSSEDPFQIATPNDLNDIGDDPCDWDKHFILTADINMVDYTYSTALIAPDIPDTSWDFDGTPFTGVFDGNNKIISHFTVNQPENSWIGLFGYIDTGGEVHNLSITDANIIGYNYVASLAGLTLNSSIDNCNTTGTLEIKGYQAGGLIARTTTSSISNCQSIVEIHSVGHSVGGLIGDNYDSSVINCHSWATVSGDNDNLGGLIGHNNSGIIVNCSSTSTVFITGQYCDWVGGLIG
ncbi:MAG: GLUG motif-containing protein, partial [Planctomycetota bacterium]